MTNKFVLVFLYFIWIYLLQDLIRKLEKIYFCKTVHAIFHSFLIDIDAFVPPVSYYPVTILLCRNYCAF